MKKSVKKSPKKSVKKASLFLKPRGVSKVLIVSIVGLVLLGAGVYFFYNQKSGGSLQSTVPFMKPALNPNCSHNDPELCKFLNNWTVQENYTVSSKSSIEGMTVESLYEMSGQDRFRMVSKQNGKESSNIISIKDTTYTLDYTDNKWWKYTVKPEEAGSSTTENIQEQFDIASEETADTTKYIFITKEPCGELQCFKYEIISTDDTSLKQYMWFDDNEYLMRKMVVSGANGESNESIYTYSKVTINEPSPVKEGMPDAGGYGASEEEMKKMMESYQDSSTPDSAQYPDYGTEMPVDEGTSSEF